MTKQLIILTGGNGSGKSTFFDRFLRDQGIHFINADEIAKRYFSGGTPEDSKKAQDYAREECLTHIRNGEPFCFETVFSHESKIELIRVAQGAEYTVDLIYIHLEDVQLNQARVINRVQQGGHPVPLDKVESRLPKTFANIKEALKIVDTARLFDNSLASDPFQLIAEIKSQKITGKAKPTPPWAKELLNVLLP